jgi:hypothetical protein
MDVMLSFVPYFITLRNYVTAKMNKKIACASIYAIFFGNITYLEEMLGVKKA